ncbi:sensor domain-containing diguanylate cyclase [Halomonas koreensis]|uniref:diguanylate cyclase n=1 Tax=Halomonas koreensis TaxID=245385 RepID=A0ABU1FY98_9GAMM|nr:diguanylate cyclase [Halomonas koreensis]MDR5865646.1 diguanylate cyclase [Halomonas koreensis]
MPDHLTDPAVLDTPLRGLPMLPDDLALRLEACRDLPSLPSVVMEVLQLSRNEEAGPADYADRIAPDPALTLRVLALANSAFYARRGLEAATCHEAVARLGTDATLAAAMSYGLQDSQAPDHFWHRSLTAAVAARELANRLCPAEAGRLFTAGLLQDIGILALSALDGESYDHLLARRPRHLRLVQAEHEAFGCDHALVGGWLARDWGASLAMARRIADSHGPLTDGDAARLCLRLSGRIADARLAEDPGLAFAKLAQSLEHLDDLAAFSLDALLEELRAALPSMAELLTLTRPPEQDTPSLLREGKQRLVELTLSLSRRLDAQRDTMDALRQENRELDHRSHTDPLTGLANRRWLERCLGEEIRRAGTDHRGLALLFIDLDHFKAFNDRHGHALGDSVLVHFAATLRDLVREGDLAGRYGGEEFMVVLPGETEAGARVVADRLLALLETQPMAETDGESLYVTASIGIASLDLALPGNVAELIDAADRQMYSAKQAGRARVSTARPG